MNERRKETELNKWQVNSNSGRLLKLNNDLIRKRNSREREIKRGRKKERKKEMREKEIKSEREENEGSRMFPLIFFPFIFTLAFLRRLFFLYFFLPFSPSSFLQFSPPFFLLFSPSYFFFPLFPPFITISSKRVLFMSGTITVLFYSIE